MSEMTLQELLLGIQCGIFDDDFDDIFSAISRRRKALAATRLSDLMMGDHFRMRNITPKSHEGRKVELIGFKGNSVEVIALEAIPASGRRRAVQYGEIMTIPSVCIGEKV